MYSLRHPNLKLPPEVICRCLEGNGNFASNVTRLDSDYRAFPTAKIEAVYDDGIGIWKINQAKTRQQKPCA